MSAETFNTRSTVTGRLQRLTEDQIKPFAKVLEIVADDAKPFEPGFFKPGEVGEFKNPEPAPDAVAQAQAAYDELLKDNSPQSKVVKEAKAALVAAEEQAEEDRAAALEAAADAEAESARLVAEAQEAANSGDSSTSEGDHQ